MPVRFSLLFCFVLLAAPCCLLQAQKSFSDHVKKGRIAFDKSDFKNATVDLHQAILAFKPGSDSVELGECCMYLAMTYGKLEDYARAEKYANEAREIFVRKHNNGLLLRTYNVLGTILAVTGKKQEALLTYKKCLGLADVLKESGIKGSVLYNLGEVNNDLGNFNEATRYYERALALAVKRKSSYGMAMCLINLGVSHAKLKNYKKAMTCISEGLEKANTTNDLYLMQTSYQQLSDVYAAAGNDKQAYRYLNLYTKIKDSISSIEINKKIQEQEARFQSQRNQIKILQLQAGKQKSEIAVLESEKKIKSLNTTLYIIMAVGLVIVIISLLLYRQYKGKLTHAHVLEQKNNELNKSLVLNQKLQQALRHDADNYKQLAYRKQMNPHFIFNSLNAIQNYILTKSKLEANLYLGELATLIRRILENSEKELITLKEELFINETYIRLEQKRFEGEFEYRITVSPDVDPAAVKIPPLLLQPFIENAIWHGLLHRPHQALLEISVLRRAENTIVISIKDNGVGREQSAYKKNDHNSKSESMGLNLTAERIHLNNYLATDEISLHIRDLVDSNRVPLGTEVTITIQQKTSV